MLPLIALLSLGLTGCSVFISTPQVARIHMQRPDNKFVDYIINLDDPCETNLDIRLNNKYALQVDFDWLWNMDERSEIYNETEVDAADARLTPWMLCKYRF